MPKKQKVKLSTRDAEPSVSNAKKKTKTQKMQRPFTGCRRHDANFFFFQTRNFVDALFFSGATPGFAASRSTARAPNGVSGAGTRPCEKKNRPLVSHFRPDSKSNKARSKCACVLCTARRHSSVDNLLLERAAKKDMRKYFVCVCVCVSCIRTDVRFFFGERTGWSRRGGKKVCGEMSG
jgi:hypothetical protein